MKTIAFYLPQFHTIPENDQWWGKGFTEWVNVKKSQPLFTGHRQPRVPLSNNYYDLSDVEILRWQSELIQKYLVDGMCFYHYWFNGKLLLEKPLELLLGHKDINMPFCLSWANEPWTRAWDGGDKDMLISQEYGSEQEWSAHFKYLLQAFKDPRYIKINNKPMFIIYRAEAIGEFDKMISHWQIWAIENGFPGLHIVISNTYFKDKNSSIKDYQRLDFEPMYTLRKERNFMAKVKSKISSIFKTLLYSNTLSMVYSYDDIWLSILKRPIQETCYPGAFVDWDNSPRKQHKGTVFNGMTAEKFKFYFSQQYNRAKSTGCDFLFVNAWNEWAEGAYLEPDEEHAYALLEVIQESKKMAE